MSRTTVATKKSEEPTLRQSFTLETTYRRDTSRKFGARAQTVQIYVHPAGESIMENLVNRHDRPQELYRSYAMMVLSRMGIKPTQLSWSQYCGCSCPCSPGFRAKFNEDDMAKLRKASGIAGSGVIVFISVMEA